MSGVDFASTVRAHATATYVNPARQRRDRRFTVRAGDVHKSLHFHNRVPVVCNALRSEKFLAENGLLLVGETGPPSGLSTTVEYTYEFVAPPAGSPFSPHPLLALRGSWKDIFQALGGGEAFLKRERAHFDEADVPDEEETRR